jgi:UDP-N-acetyl-D-glucosamine dehydrogenase
VDLTPDEVSAADAVVIVTPHAVFDLDMVAEHARYLFDTRKTVRSGDAAEFL